MSDHPRLPGVIADGGTLADTAAAWPIVSTEVVYDSDYLSVTLDTIADAGGAQHQRSVVRPQGAVGVLALDEHDRILLVQQYRHPTGHRLLEIPAGTLDVVGEPAVDAAARELAEEADVLAGQWSTFLTMHATPGYSSERWEVFLATDLSVVPMEQRTVREAEEADMQQWWLPLSEAVAAVFDGRITDSMTVAAILGIQARRSE